MNGRRGPSGKWRSVPRRTGKRLSSVSSSSCRVAGAGPSSTTSPSRPASARRWAGSTTRIMAGSAPPPTALPAEPARFQSIHGQRTAQNVDIAMFLRQAPRERFPLMATGARTIDAKAPVGRKMLGIAFDRHDVDGFRLVRMHGQRKPEIARQIAAHLLPAGTTVVAAHHIPVLLHVEYLRACGMTGDPMDAMADLRLGIGQIARLQAAVQRLPAPSAVGGAENTGGGDGYPQTRRVGFIEQNGVQAEPARPGMPVGTGAVRAQARHLLPVLPAVA